MTITYPKRLIEVDLPIREISTHSQRDKKLRHGHISTLHLWWARRPLAACRAVTCAALWPDPVDDLCPQAFRDKAKEILYGFADVALGDPPRGDKKVAELTQTHRKRWQHVAKRVWKTKSPGDLLEMRGALLDFIADFANWDSSTVPAFLETSRALTQAAHEALGGQPGTRPLVVDPFAGGGAIPLEALRVGADAFASDLNPVAVLLNKVVLEYIPKYGQQLADDMRKWGAWIKAEAEKELSDFYPKDPDGATPIAYLWARTIQCEGPGCGAEVPLVKSLWLAKRKSRLIALRMVPNRKTGRVDFDVDVGITPSRVGDGTVRNGAATCPFCGYTTANPSVRKQLAGRHGGAADARLMAVVIARKSDSGRNYRLPIAQDAIALRKVITELERRREKTSEFLSMVPDEVIPPERPSPNARGLSAVTKMGIGNFGDLYSPRQALILTTFVRMVREISLDNDKDIFRALAIRTCLSLAINRVAERCCTLARWDSSSKMETVAGTFGRQALPIVWDFTEQVPLTDIAGNWDGAVEWIALVCETLSRGQLHPGTVVQASATAHPLPDDQASALFTDPPYYDSVPYADLSDFFYVWLKRSLGEQYPALFEERTTPKDEEAIWNPSRKHSVTGLPKDENFYRSQMAKALAEGRRITTPEGIGVVVFAHKTTAGWEAVLSALVEAGWITTASWPVDTEMSTRVNARGTASLASSVHLVCRPRENPDGSVRADEIGDWRTVLGELPKRIHEWMPRLAAEGVVGADAIFSCIGPALEIFSRYSRVEKASGETVTLKEYLENIWAAVSREALSLIFEDADATGLEEDARLTAMWLWTLSTTKPPSADDEGDGEDDAGEEDDEEGKSKKPKTAGGFVLEFDAARKIAQGLGAHLEGLKSLVEVKGETARLLAVGERARCLFGKEETHEEKKAKKQRKKQMNLFGGADGAIDDEVTSLGELGVPPVGTTTLDQVHQAMLLFGAGRSEALKRFLVDESVGQSGRLWKLAQSLSALYPPGSTEKRWVDGVLARKKGLGF